MSSEKLARNQRMGWFDLPPVIAALTKSRQSLKAYYDTEGNGRLSFTPDGNLVGDIGEALAIEKFGLAISPRNDTGIDGTVGKLTVQVKTTGSSRGPAFRDTEICADHLLFFQIDFENNRARIVYNGPENTVRLLLKAPWKGQKSVSILQMEELDRGVPSQERLGFDAAKFLTWPEFASLNDLPPRSPYSLRAMNTELGVQRQIDSGELDMFIWPDGKPPEGPPPQ